LIIFSENSKKKQKEIKSITKAKKEGSPSDQNRKNFRRFFYPSAKNFW